MRYSKPVSEAEIVEVYRMKRPKIGSQLNVMFKIKLLDDDKTVFMHYELALEKYPQTVIQYLTKLIKVIEPDSNLKPILDCDRYSSKSPETKPIPAYFKLPNTKKCVNNQMKTQPNTSSKSPSKIEVRKSKRISRPPKK